MKRALVLLLLLGLPPAVYFTTLGARRDAALQSSDAEQSELDRRIAQAHAAQRKLAQFREEVQKLDAELTKLRTILPAQMALDEVRALAEGNATREGVRLTKFVPAALKDIPPMQQQSVDVQVIGNAEGIARFLRAVQNAARVIDVSSVTLRKDPGGWRTDLVMTCYAMPDVR